MGKLKERYAVNKANVRGGMKTLLRKGDMVQVLSGDDGGRATVPGEAAREGARPLGKRGKVLKMFPREGRAIVEGLNIIHKHVRPDPRKGHRGGRLDVEAPLALSKLALICKTCDRPARVRVKLTPEGKKIRTCHKCGAEL